MKKNSRFGIVALAIVGIAALGFYAYSVNRAVPEQAAASVAAAASLPGIAVEAVSVKASDFVDQAAAVGNLNSRESVVLRPEIAGRVAAINFRDGTIVSKGTLLFSLDAAIQAAELAQARASLALAQSNHQRNQELRAKNFISLQALDNSAAALKVQAAALQLAAAKHAKMQIRAPFTGMVGLRHVSVGDYVKEGQDLVNIEDIGTLRVDFKLPESYLGRVSQGQAVEVTSDALPGQRFTAVLDAVDPLVDQAGRAISCRARLDNAAGKLRPGLFVRVRLLFGQRQRVLMLPEQAIMPGTQPTVFKVTDGKAVRVNVSLGVRRAAQVEIEAGLSEGDIVVTAGQMKLHDGSAIRQIGQGAAGAASARQPAAAVAAQ